MSFSPVKPGGWAFGEKLLSGHLNALDAGHANAFDASGGGSYVVSDNVVFGGTSGKSWRFTLPVEFDGDTAFAAATFVNGLTALETSSFSTAQIQSLEVFGSAQFQAAAFDDTVDFNEVVNFAGAGQALFFGGTLFRGPTYFELSSPTFDVPINFTGTGKIKFRQKVLTVTGNQSVLATSYDTILVPLGLMGAGDNITIDDTGAQDGMRIGFVTLETINSVSVVVPGPQSYALKNAAGFYQARTFERVAGVWRPISSTLL